MSNPRHKHRTDRSRSGNLDSWRYEERMEVVAQTGTLHERMARPGEGELGGRSEFLKDDGSTLGFDEYERTLVGGAVLARSTTGGLTLRSGNLREVLAAADGNLNAKPKDPFTAD